MANSYLTHTTSTPTNDKIMTFSMWLKKEAEQVPIMSRHIDSSNRFQLYNLDSSSKVQLYQQVGGSVEMNLSHPIVLRDFSGWYHFVIAIDTTQATASDRVKIYINGELLSNYDTATYPAQNADILFNGSSAVQEIGRCNGSDYYLGYIAHFAFVDGTALTPTSFGLANTTTGQWQFKPPSGVTWGTNGFHLKFENSGALGTDSSGNSNTFAVNGNLKQALDTPSNVYCTLNPLAVGSSAPTFSKGNNRVTGTTNAYQFSCGTLEVPLNGKWYWEVKANNNVNGSSSEYLIGAVLESRLQASSDFAEFAADGITQYGSVGTGIGQNDIISVAVDRTAATLKIYKNNSLLFTKSSLPAEIIFPMVTVFGSGTGADSNFGNGYFGGTAISSAGSNGNGSLFEYDVPSGHYALNTSNINTYG